VQRARAALEQTALEQTALEQTAPEQTALEQTAREGPELMAHAGMEPMAAELPNPRHPQTRCRRHP